MAIANGGCGEFYCLGYLGNGPGYVPGNRLVAAGFGQYQPLDPRETFDAYTRNRRIELKLTER